MKPFYAARAVLILCIGCLGTMAQSSETTQAILDPEKAGPDFQVQGEYVGEIVGPEDQKKKLGAQVIATGNGTFRIVFLPGGLPGAGWNGTTRVEEAKSMAGRVIFSSAALGYNGSISGSLLVGQTDQEERFRLQKTVRHSPTEGAKPPAGAIVLFDGSSTEELANARTEGTFLLAGATTKRSFADFTLHVEFCIPYKPAARNQDRGNSGIYIQRRYEVQILDSFGLPATPGDCAAIYKQTAPTVNMTYPPLSWQTYDIDFQAPHWDNAGNKLHNARITVKHNGVVVHDKVEIKTKTGAGQPEAPHPAPITFQDHGNLVMYRNVWVVGK